MKRNLFNLALFTALFASMSYTAVAQCSAVDFKVSPIRTINNAMSYRTKLDFDADGKFDFAGDYANGTSGTNNMSILKNDGNGEFSEIVFGLRNPAGGTFWRGDWGDFNGDGRPDVLAYFSTAPRMVIYYNDGNRGLIRGDALAFGSPSEYIEDSGDINGDNRLDIITTGPAFPGTDEPTHYLYLSIGDGVYAPRVLIAADHANVRTGDFNGDGRKDISIVKDISNSPNYTLRYWMQTPSGTFDETPAVNIGTYYPMGVDEFNGDGKADLYGTVSFTSLSFMMSNEGGYPTLKNFNPPYMDGSYRLYFGDFNGDGVRDVLDSGRAADATYGYSILFGKSGSFRMFSKQVSLDDLGIYDAAHAVDLDNDGKTDLVRFTVDLQTGRNTMDLLKATCARAGQTRTVDFDGDLRTDLALWNAESGKWSVKLAGQPDDVQTTFFGNGELGDIPVAGDFDGDGKTDHAVFREPAGTWFVLKSSDGGSVSTVNFGLAGDRPVAADYDGDGKTDIAVFREAEGSWYILRSSDGRFTARHFGTAGDVPVQSDYDGDGRQDIAVYRPADGTWYYLASSNSQFMSVRWGLHNDIPVPADYDGDGSSDIAVFRAVEGNWYIRNSSSGLPVTLNWGMSGDVPLATDHDGDGQFEQSVYRSSEKRWYMFPGHATTFGTGDEVPVGMN